MRLVITFVAILAAVAALPTELPEPAQFALVFNEDEFEDYLDAYLKQEEAKWVNASSADATPRSGCTFRINGDLGQPQPVYIHGGTYLRPNGNSGQIRLNTGQQVIVACTGSGRTIRHPNVASTVSVANGIYGIQGVGTRTDENEWSGSVEVHIKQDVGACILCLYHGPRAKRGMSSYKIQKQVQSVDGLNTATCVNNAVVSGGGWLHSNGQFGQLTCNNDAFHVAESTSNRCWGNNLVIRVGFIVNNVFHPLYWSCFNQQRMEVLYVWYDQTPENAIHQSNVDRPSFLPGPFYPGVNVNNMYTQVEQKRTIAQYVGQALADRYVTNTQFLARGHLAAKSDKVFATGQRASFYFINAAPQWQPFNGGNWNTLEQNLRARIGAAGYRTTIYTGTFGVTQLRDQSNRLVDIYLVRQSNQIPVPLYYYKVVYDASRRQGTAFVGINNPYYTAAEVRSLTFCTDRCRNNNAFSWLRWQPDRIDIGYSFCCTIDDFRRTVPHLPAFTTTGLLA